MHIHMRMHMHMLGRNGGCACIYAYTCICTCLAGVGAARAKELAEARQAGHHAFQVHFPFMYICMCTYACTGAPLPPIQFDFCWLDVAWRDVTFARTARTTYYTAVRMPVHVPRNRRPRWVSATDIAKFHDEGFLIMRSLFSEEEVGLLRAVASLDPLSAATNEETGKRSKIFFPESQSHSHDVYNAVSRCSRMVDIMEALMGDEVWLYHHKVVMKDAASFHPEDPASVGGKNSNAWAWQ